MFRARLLLLLPLLAATKINGPETLKVTKSGVGPITASTRADVATFRRLFPGYEVSAGEDYQEDIKTGDTVILRWKGDDVLIAHTANEHPGEIFSIEVLSPRVTGPHGIHVGDSFEKVAKRGQLECTAGIEQRADTISCFAVDEPWVAYEADTSQLHPEQQDKLEGRSPSRELLNKLKIRGLFWGPGKRR